MTSWNKSLPKAPHVQISTHPGISQHVTIKWSLSPLGINLPSASIFPLDSRAELLTVLAEQRGLTCFCLQVLSPLESYSSAYGCWAVREQMEALWSPHGSTVVTTPSRLWVFFVVSAWWSQQMLPGPKTRTAKMISVNTQNSQEQQDGSFKLLKLGCFGYAATTHQNVHPA